MTKIEVNFRRTALLLDGWGLFIVGSSSGLGGWDLERAVPMEKQSSAETSGSTNDTREDESPEDDVWTARIALDKEQIEKGLVEYKYLAKSGSDFSWIGTGRNGERNFHISADAVGDRPSLSVNDCNKILLFKVYRSLQRNGQLFVFGSCPELGAWDLERALPMGMVGGYKWTVTTELPRPCSFEYKFFVKYSDGQIEHEVIENRMAKVASVRTVPFDQPVQCKGLQCHRAGEIWNAWNGTMIRLTIFHPLERGSVLGVVGGHPGIGNWTRTVPMGLGPSRRLLTGINGKCWELSFPATEQAKDIAYKFVVIDTRTGTQIHEREPYRRRDFPLVSNIKHGMDEQFDGNYVAGMSFDTGPERDITIGPYPQTRIDVEKLALAGVTGVINVQTDHDFEKRKINWGEISAAYDEFGIELVRLPIIDFSGDDLMKHLSESVEVMRTLQDPTRPTRKQHTPTKRRSSRDSPSSVLSPTRRNVYVHCTAGMGRAPAVVVAYLCKERNMNPEDALASVKAYRTVAAPNMGAIKQWLHGG